MENITIKLEKLLFFLIVFLFIFIPLYPKFPLLNVSGTFVAIRLEDLFIAFTLGLWGIYLIISGRLRTFFTDTLNQTILLFFYVGFVSLISANFLTHTVSLNLSIFHYLRRVEFLLLLPAAATVIRNKKQIAVILASLSVVLLLVNLYGLGQEYLDWPVISTTNSEFSKGQILRLTPGARMNSTFAGHYDLAVFLTMALVLISALFFPFKKRFKAWLIILAAISTVVLIKTAARLSFVAAFLGVILSLILINQKKYILMILIGVGLVLVYPSQLRDRLISTVTVNLLHQGQRYAPQTDDQQLRSKLNIPTLAVKTSSESSTTSKFSTNSGTASDITPGEPVDTTQLGVYRSFQIRFNLEWPRAINALIKNPLLGTGYSSIDIATDNDILRSLGEVGILGTAALGLVLVEIIKRLYCNIQKADRFLRYFSGGVIALIFAVLINGLFIDVLEASKVASLFWLILGVALAKIET